ncbi:ABC transporter ATP-binding protein [Desmospora activa]|uniref:ABC-2 type transport system ATP-binding protein/heme exporter protein A n=1 Tax=Desmospora activa DSM 45169 TaxID=1121389 RepID=A0A2T4ZD81_9BACL|nr:ATP-binding cassette domain-containing protein [Desmospora activa]PTM59837.1 ABC-2 type transport system ATP-binding protein/heme exporter protein A [Desmospora activa DSM 45169]
MRIEWSHVNKVFYGKEEGDRFSYQRQAQTGLLDFTASLKQGVTVILGPEGSGKSTLLRVTAAAAVPDDGRITYQTHRSEVHVWSKSIAAMGSASPMEALRQRIGYVPQRKRLNHDTPLDESLLYLAQSYQLPQPKKRAAELIARWGLAGVRKQPLNELSRDVAARYIIARSLISEPPIWLLDEPAHGLDDWGWQLFMQELTRRRQHGITVLATNDLELAEAADHLLLMEAGSCRRIGPRKILTAGVPDGTVASWYRTMQTFSKVKTRSP